MIESLSPQYQAILGKYHEFVDIGIAIRAVHSQQYRRQQTHDISGIALYYGDTI